MDMDIDGTVTSGAGAVADVQPNSVVSQEMETELKRRFNQLEKSALEELVLKKTVEAFNAHALIGRLREQVNTTVMLKEKFYVKLKALQQQVTELERVVKLFEENAVKADGQQQKIPPVKFFRNVGLQMNSEVAFKYPPSPAKLTTTTFNNIMGSGQPTLGKTAAANASTSNSTSSLMKGVIDLTLEEDIKSEDLKRKY